MLMDYLHPIIHDNHDPRPSTLQAERLLTHGTFPVVGKSSCGTLPIKAKYLDLGEEKPLSLET